MRPQSSRGLLSIHETFGREEGHRAQLRYETVQIGATRAL